MKNRIFACFWLLFFTFLTGHAQKFQVQGTKVLDPEGKEFIVKGVNVNGPHWPWNRPTVPDADLIVNTWKFNTIRVNCFPSLATNGCCVNNNTNLDQIVSTFTSRKVVTMLENHDFTCKYPTAAELTTLKNWWIDLANRFKGNTYVWFNIMNEPGSGTTVDDTWKTVHEEVIKAIRSTGADNVIVLDGFSCGQEKGFTNGEDGSGILKYGPYFVQNYTNITFSLHLYADWIYGRQRLGNYFDAVRAKNLSIHIGEYGSGVDYSKAVAADVLSVCLQKNIGRMVWQWTGVDIHRLTQNSGGFAIDRTDGSQPTNLSFVGKLIWKDNRGELTANSADFTIPGPWLTNGSFEDGRDYPDGWINFGASTPEMATANLKTGSRSLRVNAGSQSGAGQPLYLLPDTPYILTAWGKNSVTPNPPSTVGFNIKAVSEADKTISIGFTETAFTQKTLEFRTPKQPTETFLFIYKGDATPAFYVDDIDVRLKGDVTAREDNGFTQAAIGVCPNPSSGVMTVSFHQPVRSARFSMQDMTGRSFPIVPIGQSENSIRLNAQTLTPGLYVLKSHLDHHHLRNQGCHSIGLL